MATSAVSSLENSEALAKATEASTLAAAASADAAVADDVASKEVSGTEGQSQEAEAPGEPVEASGAPEPVKDAAPEVAVPAPEVAASVEAGHHPSASAPPPASMSSKEEEAIANLPEATVEAQEASIPPEEAEAEVEGAAGESKGMGSPVALEEVPAGWVVTTPQDAAPASPEGAQGGAGVLGDRSDDVVAVDDEPEMEAGTEDALGWSVGSLSLLGSQLDVSAFDPGSFDKALEKSSDVKADLKEGIAGVEGLRIRLAEVEEEAREVLLRLETETYKEKDTQEHTAFMIQKARDDLDMRASELAGEKATLNFEARGLLNRLSTLNTKKHSLEGEVAELKEILVARIREMEARIREAREKLLALEEERKERRGEEERDMAAVAARQHALDEEKAACNELKDFLADRSKAVDTIEGGIMQCSEEIQMLRASILGAASGAPAASASIPGSLESSIMSARDSPLDAALGEGPLGAGSQSRASMREILQGLLSSSEGSSVGAGSMAASGSHCSSPRMYASAEGVTPGADPKQAALEMLSMVGSRSGSVYSSLRGSAAGPALADFLTSDAPVVRVYEEDAEGVSAASAAGGGVTEGVSVDVPAQGGNERSGSPPGTPEDNDWEAIQYPQME